ncbi:MAG: aspartate-semialdehyde dehydrogenase [Acidimicrobiia bacterium]|nr:aspartate-semialdehyde dehydrogenase [Acidimicrobiia bacterium]
MDVAVVGATGVVGAEMLRILDERDFPVGELRLFASPRSEGRAVVWRDRTCHVEVLARGCFEGTDLVLMEVESPISRDWAPRAVSEGAIVVDNSSAWRMDEKVPLVVAEVNPHALDSHAGIVSNPNCTTMGIMPVLKPLDTAAELRRVVVTTFQAVSGSGRAGLDALDTEIRAFGGDIPVLRRSGLEAVEARQDTYPRPIAFNVIPACDAFVGDGTEETKEERKLVDESRKILERPDLEVAATCVRVPVVCGHAAALNAEFGTEMSAARAGALLRDAPGVVLAKAHDDYKTPLEVAGVDGSHVGRLRDDETRPNTIDLFVVADNLRKGAALNCVQIAEVMLERGLLG